MKLASLFYFEIEVKIFTQTSSVEKSTLLLCENVPYYEITVENFW